MTKPNVRHVPVLLHEAIDFLRVRTNGTYVDCTLGFAGHSEAIVRRLGPEGHLIGFDRDPEAMELAKARLEMRQKAPLAQGVAPVLESNSFGCSLGHWRASTMAACRDW